MRRLFLASASPRRRQLLAQIGVFPEQLPAPDIDETPLLNEDPGQYVLRLAQAKAHAGWQRLAVAQHPESVVLAADTTVVLEGCILGKPADAAEARAMLEKLSGRQHGVLTAVAVATEQGVNALVASTRVTFLPLEAETLTRYIASGEPFDKAGGYGIQGFAAAFVSEIRGSYSGVVGLPLAESATLLQQAGVPIWQMEGAER